MRRQLYTSLLCFCLLIVMFVGSSLAWFSDDVYYKDTVASGNLKITQTMDNIDKNVVPGATYKKQITVTNEGNIPCFVRTLVAFEDSVNGEVIEKVHPDKIVIDESVRIRVIVTINDVATETIYTIGVYTHQQALVPSGNQGSSVITMGSFTVDASADNAWTTAVGTNYDIHALTQATQAVGWENHKDLTAVDAETALNEVFGAINSENAASWFAEMFQAKYGSGAKVEAFVVNNG